ncbi:hypothetical protein BVC80_1721g32 [Macleaya cordata]|uniref:Uncharacterized protein n=1 Tax=Macleaya cordata TaxID=56857 RepID=A0A200QCM5_MACCD|nr:hypothetical protein BVC80_1721g32 [Macleaya cordata]
MSSKTLARTSVSLINRFLSPFSHQKPISNHNILTQGTEIAPQLFPSFSKFQTSLHSPENDEETLKRISYEGFMYPCGLPSLRFFLPDGDDSSSSEPLSLLPKRTYQPSHIKRYELVDICEYDLRDMEIIITKHQIYNHLHVGYTGCADLGVHDPSVDVYHLGKLQGNEGWQESHCTEGSKGSSKNHSVTIQASS